MSRVAITLDEHAHAELATPRAGRQGAGRPDSGATRPRRAALQPRRRPPASPPRPPQPGQQKVRTRDCRDGLSHPASESVWRRELWAAVSALAERYPRVFSKLVADWWTDRALIEVLGALSAWRSQLDSGREPRPARRAVIPRPPGDPRPPAHPSGRPDRRALRWRAAAVRVGHIAARVRCGRAPASRSRSGRARRGTGRRRSALGPGVARARALPASLAGPRAARRARAAGHRSDCPRPCRSCRQRST